MFLANLRGGISRTLPRGWIHSTNRLSSYSSNRDIFRQGSASPITDTIFALSSGPMVKSGVAVIRLSGPSCRHVITSLQTAPIPTPQSASPLESSQDATSMKSIPFPQPRRASVRTLYCPQSGDALDKAIVLWMPGPHSFTGEDVCELHVHGSRAVVLGVFEALERLDKPSRGAGIRAAERGEFTRRAFENNRMDLTGVEGLADLLEADTSLQRNQALRQMDGHISRQFEIWRKGLVKCLAHTEAVIDFGDDDREDDVQDTAMLPLFPIVRQMREEIEKHLKDGRRGELVREGLRVTLVGPPNAGKSTLMNALARRPAAIVSPIAGTTRDIVEVRLELGGIPCIVSDTAGLREYTEDIIEQEGIRRAKDSFKRAHVKVFVGDVSDSAAMNMLKQLLKEEQDTNILINSRVAIVLNKIDLLTGGSDRVALLPTSIDGIPAHAVSCSTGYGIANLEEELNKAIKSLLDSSPDTESTLITRERHRRHLQQCAEHLDRFLHDKLWMDAAAEELRLAAVELGRVTGRFDIEELLDVIFRDFCIGK